MKTPTDPRWIKHSHLFGPDEYECSACRAVFRRALPACPNCGAKPRKVVDRKEWIDEQEQMNWMRGDD